MDPSNGLIPPNRSMWAPNNYPTSGGYAHMRSSCRETPYNSMMNRFNTPSQYPSTSQYYNPLETDNYLPSYDNEVQTHHYCFASPMYSSVWSPPPTNGRKSASQTPIFGSIRRVNENDEQYHATPRHVYPPTATGDGGSGSSRSIDDCTSPQVNHVYAIGSVRDDLDTNANSPKEHVYATSCCDNSSSPQQIEPCTESPSHHYSGESSRSIEQDEQNVADD